MREALSNLIEEVLEVNHGPTLRIKVFIDMTKRLHKGVLVDRGDSQQ